MPRTRRLRDYLAQLPPSFQSGLNILICLHNLADNTVNLLRVSNSRSSSLYCLVIAILRALDLITNFYGFF